MLVVAEVGAELGIEDAVDEAFFELGEQAVRAEQVGGLAVVFEKLVEERVGDFRFHWMCWFW